MAYVLMLQTPVPVVFSVPAITRISAFRPINTSFIFHIHSFVFNYALIFFEQEKLQPTTMGPTIHLQ